MRDGWPLLAVLPRAVVGVVLLLLVILVTYTLRRAGGRGRRHLSPYLRAADALSVRGDDEIMIKCEAERSEGGSGSTVSQN